MKNLLLASTMLVTAVSFVQAQAVKGEPDKQPRVSAALMKLLTGSQEKVLAVSMTGRNSVIETQSAMFYFSPGEDAPFLGFVSRPRQKTSNGIHPIEKGQITLRAKVAAELLQFNIGVLKPQIRRSGASLVRSTNQDSYFVYYEENPEGIPTLGCGRNLELQFHSLTGQLLGFKCRRYASIVGGKSLGVKSLNSFLVSVAKSERLVETGFLWRNVKQFASTRQLSTSNTAKIIKTYFGSTAKKTFFLRADNGKLLGVESVR